MGATAPGHGPTRTRVGSISDRGLLSHKQMTEEGRGGRQGGWGDGSDRI